MEMKVFRRMSSSLRKPERVWEMIILSCELSKGGRSVKRLLVYDVQNLSLF